MAHQKNFFINCVLEQVLMYILFDISNLFSITCSPKYRIRRVFFIKIDAYASYHLKASSLPLQEEKPQGCL